MKVKIEAFRTVFSSDCFLVGVRIVQPDKSDEILYQQSSTCQHLQDTIDRANSAVVLVSLAYDKVGIASDIRTLN